MTRDRTLTRVAWLSFAGFLFAAVAGFTVGWTFIAITFGGT